MLKVSNVSKDYGTVHVLRDISFRFTVERLLSLRGPLAPVKAHFYTSSAP